MSMLTDRLVVLLLAATMLGGVLFWVVGFVRAEATGTTRIALLTLAGVTYGAVLVGIWFAFERIDRE